MIELIILKYLKSEGFNVFMEYPKNAPTEFILIEKVGGGVHDFLKTSTIAVQSYADSLYKASRLNEKVKTSLLAINKLNEISSVSLNSDYNFTDLEMKKYRYQGIYDLVYY